VTALEEVLNLNFGKAGRDIYGDSKDNKHFINKVFPKGWLDLVDKCRKCKGNIGLKICDLLAILGPIGTSPDNIAESKRRAICSIMKGIHRRFHKVNFRKMEKI